MNEHWAKARLEMRDEQLAEACAGRNPEHASKKGFGEGLAQVIRATSVLQAADSMGAWEVLDGPSEQREAANEYYDLVTLTGADNASFANAQIPAMDKACASGNAMDKAIDEGLAPSPKDVKKAQGILREGMQGLRDCGIKPEQVGQLKTPGINPEFVSYHISEMQKKGPSGFDVH